ncbi:MULTISPECIES: alpha/beta hydrolase family protein [unclassified Idiomarina]|jgi:dipeptidyl aminopeptidase/acylaminoacyl peptidase|uniref:alpha/beta hydrolase family protein n=1 Tax=unclassified Idiomarina TaxID=2614829 RepID=UPI0025802262|nr:MULTISPECIES: prolyl oligopeptidase family serine peptidase [unclassified Idiomarina]|tara:strand:+ start:5214 stop:6164 length:951 start_codon:yes stop_codon:yes gene_type:complete
MIRNITKLALMFIPLIFSDSSLANESGDILREKKCLGDTYEEAKYSRINKKEFLDLKANFTCKVIVYQSGQYPVGGILLTPKTENDQKVPAVIFNRGGNGRFGALNYSSIFLHLKPIAEMGVAVLATQYRGGMELTDGPAESVDEFGGSDVKDVINIVRLASQLPYVDENQIHMVGFSRGAMSAFISLKELSNIKSLTVLGGPSDLFKTLEERPEMEKVFDYRVPSFTSNKESELRKRSVVYWLDELPGELPILILHGAKDERVSVEQAKILADKLSDINHPHKLVIYDDYHGLPFSQGLMYKEINAWITGEPKAE